METIVTTIREVPFTQFSQLKANAKADDFGGVYSGATAKAATIKVVHADVLNRILATLKDADFLTLGGFRSIEDIKQKHFVVLSVSDLLRTVKAQGFALARKNDFIFLFNGEYWREINRDAMKDFLGKAAEKLGVSRLEAQHYDFKDKLYKQFLAAGHFDQVEPDKGQVLINLQNGTFEISATVQTLREFRSEDFLRHQLPFDYDPQAQSPLFNGYLARVLPEPELRAIVAEYFGYVFTKRLKLEKALLLYGSGANGKSVLFDVMNAVLGKENTSNFSLSDLLQEHNRALIANKLLNYGSEINASVTRDTFKNLVSVEPIMARLKYGNSFMMEDYAKLCFNCNELPKDIEQTEAYFRRLLIVPFAVTIPANEQDPELAQKIIANEMSGVFNWILSGLQRLLKHKRFTHSETVRKAIADYREDSDSAACFIKEAEPSDSEGLLKDVYASYRAYCSDSGVKPLGKVNFGRRLQANGYEIDLGTGGKKRVSKAAG